MARFYGWTWQEIQSTPYRVINDFWTAMRVIEAEEYQRMIKSSTFADMKKASQDKIIREIRNDQSPLELPGSENRPNLEKLLAIANQGKKNG